MSWEQIQTYLVGLAVSAIVWLVRRYVGVKMSAEQTSMAQWAIEQGVAYAALKLKDLSGAEKKAAALSVAHSLAPKAIKRFGETEQSTLVESTYARLKPSLPNTTFVMSGADIPVDTVKTNPLPPPSKVPKLS